MCGNCKRTFTSALELELHRDHCGADDLFCEGCGETFAESDATEDGWHYRCPTEGCSGEGIGEDLHAVDDVRITQ